MQLHEFIASRKGDVLRAFTAEMGRRHLAPGKPTDTELVDDLPRLLDAIVEALARQKSRSESASDREPDNGDLARGARDHGDQRIELGFDLEAVVYEYGVLRDVLFAVVRGAGLHPTLDESQSIAACVDAGISEAVREYSAHRDEELRRERARVELERQRLAAILRLLPVGVLVADADGNLVQANEAFRALWGRAAPLVGPDRYAEYKAWWPHNHERVAAKDWSISRALATGLDHIEDEMLIESFDGSLKRIMNSAFPMKDASGIVGAVAVSVDVTERSRALEESQRAVREREDVLAVVSHELRNPLNAVSLVAAHLERLARTEDRTPAALDQLSARLRRNATRMTRLVTDLLDLSRIEGGRLSLVPEPLQSGELLAEALEMMRHTVEEKHAAIELAPSQESLVSCDRDRILQVFANLIGNATRFVPHGGTIRIAAHRKERQCEFVVADDGPGIDLESQSHIFDRFWQAPASVRHGIGLGLAIAKGIVEAHGGEIRVESAIGSGSRFFFEIPLLA
jgi:PAS domain S-box-containing protein